MSTINDLIYDRLLHLASDAVRSGNVFAGASGVISVGLNNRIKGTLENPATSKKRLYIYKIVVSAQEDVSVWARLHINPTGGLPTTVKSNRNQYVGHPRTSPAILKVDAGAGDLTGGVATGQDFLVRLGRAVIDLEPLVVPPGVTLGIATDPVAVAANMLMIPYWYQEDV